MIVGILTVDFMIPGSNSLKDKRQVVKSVVDTVRNKFNVSAAELESLDSWRRAVIGVACISNDKEVANTLLNRVLASIESNPRLSVTDCRFEFV